MTENNLPRFDSYDEPEASPRRLQGASLSTETIDISALFSPDVYSSGTFDLSSVGSTSFGRLLDALPMPAILIDQWNNVGFVNQACGKISPNYKSLRGVPVLELVPRPTDKHRAQTLAGKMLSLLQKVLTTRKPQVAEAILEIQKQRIWARLHLRAVRIGSDRHVLVLIEDLTHEKRQLELNRRQEKDFGEFRRDLETLVQATTSELASANERLRREVADHLRTQRALKGERQKCRCLSEHASLATATVSHDGTFRDIDRRFTEMFGYELEDLASFRGRIFGADHGEGAGAEWLSDWLDRLESPSGSCENLERCVIMCQDRSSKEAKISGLRLDDGSYFVIFEQKKERACEK